jgi:virulence factor Mce-like protein
MARYVRPLMGLVTVAILAGTVAFSAYLFRGGLIESVPVTVMSPRAGLVMNPGAKVKMRGVEVGRVASIVATPNGQAAIRLSMNPAELQLIPSNVRVNIASSTVFGAKSVLLVPPADPSPKPMYAGQVLGSDHVVVELNTVFEKLRAALSKIEPAKLNVTLSAMASALSGRGAKLGHTLSDLDQLLAILEPSLPNLSHDIATAPAVVTAYADAAPDLLATIAHATDISRTVVDDESDLDALLISAIGFADIGHEVVGSNGPALINLLHLLVPTTDLANRYHAALTCALQGVVQFAKNPPPPEPGIVSSIGIVLGSERYRYPTNLPKVAAKGGPNCENQQLPDVPAGFSPPFVVADVGTNPGQYSNPGILLNFDGIKQLLFGPIAGPPRNSAQIGMPG